MSKYLSSVTKKPICPVCGREESPDLPFIGNMCRDCFLDKYGVAYVPSSIHITICNSCGAYKIGKQWVYMYPRTLEEAVYEAVYSALLSKIKPVQGVKTVSIGDIVSLSRITSFGEFEFKVIVNGTSFEGVDISKEYIVKVRVSAGLCPRCIRKKVGYHEALVQIRGIGGKLDDYSKSSIVRFLENLPLRLREQMVDVLDKKEGIDILVTDATSARIIASKISVAFLGHRIETYSLSGRRNDGRRLGHLTISLRIANLKKGDLVVIDRDTYYVKDIGGGKIRLINLDTGREENMDSDKFWSHKVEKYMDKRNLKRLMLLSRDPFTTVFMDVDTGYSSTIEYPSDRIVNLLDSDLVEGTEYIVYLTDNNLYILS